MTPSLGHTASPRPDDRLAGVRRFLERSLRPEYLYRPTQVFRRLRTALAGSREVVSLAWGLPIRIIPGCRIGKEIENLGVFERDVTEAVCRLTDPGDLLVDVGANVGHISSLMALKGGPEGQVLAFEPHPKVRSVLEENVERWASYGMAPIEVHGSALGKHRKESRLFEPGGFATNTGGCSLIPMEACDASFVVLEETLDNIVSDDASIGLIKIDVEGYESAVLDGAASLLAAGRIRDIVFEDAPETETAAKRILRRYGYQIMSFPIRWSSPCLVTLEEDSWYETRRHPMLNFYATLDPDRARRRFRSWGWEFLRIA